MSDLDNTITLKDSEVKLLLDVIYEHLYGRDDDSDSSKLMNIFSKLNGCLDGC